MTKYVDKAMFTAEPMDESALASPRVHVLSATPDPLGSLAATCLMYEGTVIRDLSEVTDEQRLFYFRDVMNTTLQAPLENIDFHFMVEGLTRASWDQMVRQRTANFAGESLRFAVKFPLQYCVRSGPMVTTEDQKSEWTSALQKIEKTYMALIDSGVPAEDARGILPLNVLVRGHWKTNLRNLITEVGKRSCTQAQWEWKQIIASMRMAISKFPGYPLLTEEHRLGVGYDEPVPLPLSGWQFRAIAHAPFWSPVCFQTGRCMFKAKADRGCTIRSRVEAGEFDKIDPMEWVLDPTAGWVR